jgi:phosphatidylglycerol:prolipoprotein diacylglycerol transferase
MHPVLIDLGFFKFYSYGAMLVVSFLCSTVLAVYLGKKRGYSEDAVIELCMGAILAGIIGCRVGYVVMENPTEYIHHPLQALNFREGGMTITGGVTMSVAYLLFISRKSKTGASVLNLLDYLGGPLLIGMAVGRLGCLLHGCCYGELTHVPWAITYPEGNLGPGIPGGPRHPSVLYEAAADLVLMAYVLWRLPRVRYAGEVFYSVFAGYGIIRFLDEFTRHNDEFILGLPLYQWVSLAFFFFGAAGLLGIFGRRAVNTDILPKEGEVVKLNAPAVAAT